ncbi:MAG: STAS domain-containing protein [Sterolibacteriaceae bacterium MAG5]|nr:STAS domain-containing protein [Candidatus Nitricoxidireducens bremensis]
MKNQAIARQGGMGRLMLPARFDIMSTAEYRISFARFVKDAATNRLEVDFAQLEYIDSLGIGTLLSWDSTCRKSGKSLVLKACPPTTLKLFRLAGVDGLFTYS